MNNPLRPKDHPFITVTDNAVVLLDTGTVGLEDGESGKATAQDFANYVRVKVSWGDLSGALINQTDLQVELNNKQQQSPILDNTTASYTVTKDTKLASIGFGAQLASVVAGTNMTIDVSDPQNPILNATGSGGGSWGSITGTLSDQTDLQSALDAKVTAVIAGTNIVVDNTDPQNPIINASTGGSPVWGAIAGTLSDQTDLQNALDLKIEGIDLSALKTSTQVTINNTAGNNAIISEATGTDAGVLSATDKTKIDSVNANAQVATVVAGANITVDNTDPENPVVSSIGGGGGSQVAIPVTGDFTAGAGNAYIVTGDADITIPAIAVGEIFKFHAVSGVVRVLNPVNTINGSNGTVNAGDDMIISIGSTRELVVEATNTMRLI